MQVPTSSQPAPSVTVDNSATVVRGFSTEVRSDVPPVQQSEGVRYTRGRPSDNETYGSLYNARRKSGAATTETLATPAQPVDDKEAIAQRTDNIAEEQNTPQETTETGESSASATPSSATESAASNELAAEDEALVEQLQKRDREVRLHEQAHQTAGGRFTGSANYEYRRGPDGKNYAVGGEVSVDVGPADDPEATIQKARQVRAAALAPAQPSPQDRQVAQEAEQLIADAQQALRIEAQAEAKAALKARDEAAKEKTDETAAPTDAPPETGKTAEKRSSVDIASVKPAKESAASPKAPDKAKDSSTNEDNNDEKSAGNKEDLTPREALEKILLAGQSLTVQANAAGYVRPDAPAGDSGLLDVVI